jgi:U11/U12 small nuclear ribonucleoprotein SNRNP65
VPKFYEQVLHLMNKMNLPPPFGPAFPMSNRVKKSLDPSRKRKRTAAESANNTVEEFESESSESDLDEDEQNRLKKRARKNDDTEQLEGAKHIPIDQQSNILGPSIRAQGTTKPLQINLKTTSVGHLPPQNLNAPIMQQGPGRPMGVPGPGPNNMMPNMGHMPPNMMGQFNPYMPPNIPVEYIQGQATPGQAVGADVRNVITLQQLMSNRQTVDEIRMMEKFKTYSPGEPSEKLFVRNLEKRVTVEDLKFIFGRYIPADEDIDKELDVKLMTTGRLKGQAFVTFTNIQRAQQAVNEANGYVLYDRPLVIEFGRKKE